MQKLKVLCLSECLVCVVHRMTRLSCSAPPPSWRSRSNSVSPARALGTVSASWKPRPMLRQDDTLCDTFVIVLSHLRACDQLSLRCCSVECASWSGHLHLHPGAVPVCASAAGDAGQHSGDDRGEFRVAEKIRRVAQLFDGCSHKTKVLPPPVWVQVSRAHVCF